MGERSPAILPGARKRSVFPIITFDRKFLSTWQLCVVFGTIERLDRCDYFFYHYPIEKIYFFVRISERELYITRRLKRKTTNFISNHIFVRKNIYIWIRVSKLYFYNSTWISFSRDTVYESGRGTCFYFNRVWSKNFQRWNFYCQVPLSLPIRNTIARNINFLFISPRYREVEAPRSDRTRGIKRVIRVCRCIPVCVCACVGVVKTEPGFRFRKDHVD